MLNYQIKVILKLMNKIFIVTLISLFTSCLKTEKVQIKKSSMTTSQTSELLFEVSSIQVTDSMTSNGSTHPMHDITYFYNYSPTKEESEELLDNLKINNKVSLRDYLKALKNSDNELLSQFETKPQGSISEFVNNTIEKLSSMLDSSSDEDTLAKPVGGMNSNTIISLSGPSWSIRETNALFFSHPSVKEMARSKGENSSY
jgi:hypothetical protein